MPVVINGFPNQKNTITNNWSYGTPYPRSEDTPKPGVIINGANVEWRA
jgi:hypothetical protein